MLHSQLSFSTSSLRIEIFWAATIECLVCCFWMKDCRFMPVRFVHVGGLASQYGMVWTTWMHGIREIGPMRTTVFASVLALSSP